MQLKAALLTLLPWLQPTSEPDETEAEAQSDRPEQPVVMSASYSTRRAKKIPGRRSPAGPR